MSDAGDAARFRDREGALAFIASLAPAGERELPIAEAALAFASLDRPQVDLERYRDHLHELAQAVAAAGPVAEIGARAAALAQALVGRFRYEGDRLSYEDLQNANLMRVIDRRKGLPVALGILYLHAGRAQGWPMAGLAFPGHFLLRIEDGGARGVIDPFNGGKLLDAAALRELLRSLAGDERPLAPEHYRGVSDRDVLLRLQNNLKLRLLQSGDRGRALAVLERMRLLVPESAALAREAGVLLAEQGELRAAIRSLEQALALEPESRLRFATASLLQDLRTRLQ